ncbi:alpha/beta hydrolase [Legionella israelensis]|uniref:Alpha/beta superfamily transporter hydrolase n=1 Tax=Legionella israelensis TaxID=454 RepID=A0A0W0W0Y9_9GAMM|nr:alpha/beta hydrolase [Legionella israelensis]KTD26101.1 alpha/beta superfamily transporter hydrolase [Legionella israelensis]QBS10112.1 hypothetical protein E4T55_09750 [Legionella israelensis]QDP73524.1 hypothetical protein FOG18_13605 [Legionella israelensis]SCY07969.1 hypothetical protein SAMN02746069_01214 [Legionella israelensis DSM 19235]STX59699.1 transmembrane protein [Legionella israelensis]
MLFADKLNKTGEHAFVFQGAKGQLEGVLAVPESLKENSVAILGHPHSLQGGTMNNKVVTTLARTFKELGIPSLRFNFRGVGASEGQYDAGIGESKDMLALTHLWLKEQPESECFFAGFSFGSYVAYRAAAQCPHRTLVTVAPPVHHYDYHEFSPPPEPWIILQGNEDEVTPAELVNDFAIQIAPAPKILRFEDTGHFFHGKLIELKSRLFAVLEEEVLSD